MSSPLDDAVYGPKGQAMADKRRAAYKSEPRIHRVSQEEAAVNDLLDKLDRWILAQPEWLYLMSHGRHMRRRVAREVAAELLTIPLRTATDVPNRKLRRRIMQALRKGEL